MSDKIIEAVRDFWNACPLLDENNPLNVDYLDDIKGYSIDVLPSTPYYKRYVDGGGIRQFLYTFISKQAYDGDMRTQLDNSGLFEDIAEWLEEQTAAGHMPQVEGHRIHDHSVTTTGYLFSTDTDLARYQIQFRLLYT